MNSICISPVLLTGMLLIPAQIEGSLWMSLALVGGNILAIFASMQFPPEAPVSNKVFVVVVPTSMSAEHLNSGRE